MSAAPRAVLFGLGLIGGSIGIGLRRAGWRVGFIDPRVELTNAVAARAADEAGDPAAADLVVLAVPVDAAISILRSNLPPGILATSASSLMAPLAEAAEGTKARFIPGHPMAGSERSGLAAADGDLFRGRAWFFGAPSIDPLLERLVSDLGATAVPVDPAAHDRAVALTSHLPQVLSIALASVVAREIGSVGAFTGEGLKTFLRLAGSSHEVWSSTLESGGGEIARWGEEVFEVARRIARGEGAEDFERANELWRKLSS